MLRVLYPNRWLIWIVAIIVIILLFVWYKIQMGIIEMDTLANQQVVLPLHTKSNVSQIDTSNWKTYRNEKYGFEFKYLPGWIIVDDGLGLTVTEGNRKYDDQYCAHGVGCVYPDERRILIYISELKESLEGIAQRRANLKNLSVDKIIVNNMPAYKIIGYGAEGESGNTYFIQRDTQTLIEIESEYGRGNSEFSVEELKIKTLNMQHNIVATLKFFDPNQQ